jgi:transcriptional regulator with GAF, ATPase, and Fis domain
MRSPEIEHMPTEAGPSVEQADAGSAATPPALQQPVHTEHVVAALANLRRQLADLERERLLLALKESGGNQSLAARRLGMSRRSLVYRLTAFGLTRPRKRRDGAS